MTPLYVAVGAAGNIAVFATGVGLAVRGRWRLSLCFAGYVATLLICETLVLVFPSRFWNWDFWTLKQSIYDILKLGIALELACRTSIAFPGARVVARRIALAILVLTSVALAAGAAAPPPGFYVGPIRQTAWLVTGTIWLIAATLAVVDWHRVPLHPFHRSLLVSYVAYLGVFSTVLTLITLYGFEAVLPYANAIDPPAHVVMTCWWALMAWRPETDTAFQHAETLKLQLRTASCG